LEISESEEIQSSLDVLDTLDTLDIPEEKNDGRRLGIPLEGLSTRCGEIWGDLERPGATWEDLERE